MATLAIASADMTLVLPPFLVLVGVFAVALLFTTMVVSLCMLAGFSNDLGPLLAWPLGVLTFLVTAVLLWPSG
jgi:hypothetical protein